MNLKPSIASYSGQATSQIRQYLDDRVLNIIASIACSPQAASDIAGDVLAELVAMRVLKEQAGQVTLATSVFLRNDIERIVEVLNPLVQELSQRIVTCGTPFRHAPPEITVFLAGIIGFVQGVGANLPPGRSGDDWKRSSGKYGQSKVDFDEVCDVFEAIGPDFLNKSVLPGERYTAVFIGSGGHPFWTFFQPMYTLS